MEHSHSSLDGQTISHYRIVEKLGAGGMGEVYLAEDTKLGRKVALKLLSEEYISDKDRLHRFEQEACAASALNHPNILTIYEVGMDSGRHYMATEFIDGQTLRHKMAGSIMSIKSVLDISIQIAGALEEAHAAGILHRDIKPENVMVRRNGYVKLLDFGLAKLTEKERSPTDTEAATRVLVQTDTGVVMGTSRYMSPEQSRGQSLDVRSDLWSFGVVMYELIAGKPPFDGETATDVIVAITQKEPPPLARFSSEVPAELEWIVTKALRKDRDERYQTAKELLTDLRRLKQRLDFEAELERSVSPESMSAMKTASGATMAATTDISVITQPASAHTLSSAEYIVEEIKRHKTGAGIVALVFVIALASGLTLYFKRAQGLTNRDTILLADFVNSTGEPVFDGTLKQALAVQLGQSPFLNILPDERIRQALRFMGRSPDDRITRDVGREICEREGIKALLIGSISGLGSHYVISLEALNGNTGDTIAREQVEATSKEEVLSALGRASSSLRQKLGESLASIKKFDVSIEQATTSSLDALKAFAMGNELRAKGKATESAASYKTAIQLDPNFAMAYARLAVYYGNSTQLEQAKEYAQKAFDLRDRVSEHEKMYISEKYYNYVTGEVDKAIEILQSWAQTYPNDYIPHNNLAVNYSFIGRSEEGLKEALEAARLDPNNINAADNVIDSFIKLDRLDEASQKLEEVRARTPDASPVHAEAMILALRRGDQATWEREQQWATGKFDEPDMLGLSASALAQKGQLQKAEQTVKRAIDLYQSQERKENAAQVLTGLALIQSAVGDLQRAKTNATDALKLSRGRIEIGAAALALAIAGAPQAQSLVDEAAQLYPKDTGVSVIALPLIRAQFELNRGNGAAAVQLLEPLRKFDLGVMSGHWSSYLRGQAYLQQRMGALAAAEFQRILDHRGVEPTSCLHSLALLGLARASQQKGDLAASRKAYQDFFAVWRDADPNIPILVEAKKEYEGLK
ncbi:MAG TPA: protein kinase [Pyrinomonadaceae bacterium]